MIWLALSLAAAAPAWNDVVTLAVDPMAPRMLPEERDIVLQQLCGGGVDRACRWLDGASPAELLVEACEDEDRRPFDCVAAGWALEPTDPEAAYGHYVAQCDAGDVRACADVARAALDGIGTWSSRRRARKLAEPLCDEGSPHACLVLGRLEQRSRPLVAEKLATAAVSEGVSGGLGALAELVRDEDRWAVMVRGCDAGIGSVCRQMAEELREAALEELDDEEATDDEGADEEGPSDEDEEPSDEPVSAADLTAYELLDRACLLEDRPACLLSVLIGVYHERIERRDGRERLDEMCAQGEDQACLEADYLRYGGDVQPFKLGTINPLFVERLGTHVTPSLIECYRDQLDREPTFEDPDMVVHAWIDEEGIVAGGTVVTSGPDEYKECLARQVSGHEIVEGGIGVSPDHAVKVEIPIHFGHEAEIKISPTRVVSGFAENSAALQEIARDEWAEEADRCWLENQGSAWDSIFTIRKAIIRRDGRLELKGLFESSSIEEADECLAAMMRSVELEGGYEYDERVRIYIRFAQIYRHPKPKGQGHGEAMDPDLYMNRDDWGEGDRR